MTTVSQDILIKDALYAYGRAGLLKLRAHKSVEQWGPSEYAFRLWLSHEWWLRQARKLRERCDGVEVGD